MHEIHLKGLRRSYEQRPQQTAKLLQKSGRNGRWLDKQFYCHGLQPDVFAETFYSPCMSDTVGAM
jgi:hypothetical protein